MWPDVGIIGCPIFPKVAKIEATVAFTEQVPTFK